MSVDRMPLVEEGQEQEAEETESTTTGYPDGASIEDITRQVLQRIHEAELALMRHVEVAKLEASRRFELVIAQAQLGADLITLRARREALPGDADTALLTECVETIVEAFEDLRPSGGTGLARG